MSTEKKQSTDYDVKQFQASFCPWGYQDINMAIQTYFDAGKSIGDLIEDIDSYMQEVELNTAKIDPCYVAFDTLQQEARTEIQNATGKDISNDEPYYGVNVSGNYMCTTFDGKEEDYKATRELIDTMEEKSEVVQWYYNQLEA